MRSLRLAMLLSTLALASATGCAATTDEGAETSDAALSGAERAAVIDGLRAKVKPELGHQDILFNFSQGSFRSAGTWAFVMGRIQLRDGSEPKLAGTIYAAEDEAGMFDGWHVQALLSKEGGAWRVVDHGIGSTDAWYYGIEDRYPAAPRSIFPWLDGPDAAEVAPSERVSIMSSLRAVVKPELGNQDIVFNVSRGRFAVAGGYCWLQGNIELRGGGVPNTVGTDYEEADEEGFFDGWHVQALLVKEGSSWKVLEHGVGSTDVWYAGIGDRHPDAPAEIFPPEARSN